MLNYKENKMKKLLIGLAALILPLSAFGYVSNQGTDPDVGGYEAEYKSAKKSTVSGYSDAVSKGHGLYYDDGQLTGLYHVSRHFTLAAGNLSTAARFAACIAARDVATGDTQSFPCVTRGYVDYALYDATSPIAQGNFLCIGTAATVQGVFINCNLGQTSKFVALEAKTSGTGTIKLKVGEN